MTDAEINEWKKKIVAGNADYSELDPPTYKYLDKYNALMMAYRYGEKTKEECQQESVMLAKQYENDCRVYDMYSRVYQAYQENIRCTDELMSTILTTDDMSMAEALQCLCAYVAHERGEEVTAKAILRRYKLDFYDTWHALSERQRVTVEV